ncbi:MAG: DNA polymerase III subunit gamma/tau [Betaproteobacteria bacterium]|nr:DNA polymerase III subunit gamma/tau [Betaproteobacteria bacterium]
MQEHRVLARKWRPTSFADVVGQGHVLQALRHALSSGRLHHAYLFTGTRGVGKTTLARVLARALNCETGVTADPCGVCGACQAIDQGRFVDLIELDAASNTQVDRMRELLENATYAPAVGRFKVYVIDEVHQLSGSAFNAMLKTLEEPPEHVKFVLATTDPHKIPVTVLSRCMQFGLKPIAVPTISARMSHILREEGITAEPAALDLLARAARGSLRDGLSLLDQAIAFGGGQVSAGPVAAMLGVADTDALMAVLDAVSRGDPAAALTAADAVVDRGVSLDGALQELARLIKQAALLKALPSGDEPVPQGLPELAERWSAADLQVLYQIAVHSRADLDWAPDPEAGFVMAVLRMLALAGPAGDALQAGGTVTRASASPPPASPARALASLSASQPVADLAPAVVDVVDSPLPRADALAFDGDWPALLARLKLGGRVRLLADRCVLLTSDNAHLRLGLAANHRHLLDDEAQQRLRREVQSALGEQWSVGIEVSEHMVAATTPMQQRESARQERQAQALESIHGDPFVRGLVEQMGGVLVDASVRPLKDSSQTQQ